MGQGGTVMKDAGFVLVDRVGGCDWHTLFAVGVVFGLVLLHYYYIHRQIFLNLFKSNQSTAGLKPLKPAAIYIYCTEVYFYPPVSKVHPGSFCAAFRNPPNSDGDGETKGLEPITDIHHPYARYTHFLN